MKKDEIVGVLPNWPFKVKCDGETAVLKNSEGELFLTRCFEIGYKRVIIKGRSVQ